MNEILRDLLGGNVGYARELVEATANRANEEDGAEGKRAKEQSQLNRSDLMRRINRRA